MQQDITCYITFWLVSLESLRNPHNPCRQGSAIICILWSGNSVQRAQPDYTEATAQMHTSPYLTTREICGCTKAEATCVVAQW